MRSQKVAQTAPISDWSCGLTIYFTSGTDMVVCLECWHVWLNLLKVGGAGGRTCFMRVIDALLQEKRAKQA